MENREKNIFYNVIRNETSLTEVFCNLMQYKAFRDLFLNIVNEKRKNLELFNTFVIKYENFSTEKNFEKDDEKLGRGDLIVENKNEDYIFELKIERYRKLTPNQPSSYLEYLKKDDSRLFFIIPKGYMYKNDIYNKWEAETGYSKENIKQHIIFWEDILKKIRENELDKLNFVINEFCNILDYMWFYYPDIKFSYYETEILFKEQKNKKKELRMLMDTNLPKIMIKLFSIIEETNNKLGIKNKEAKTDEFYGYLLKNKKIPEKWDIWFGVDYIIWEENSLPLTIQIYSEDQEEMKKIENLDLDLNKFCYQENQDMLDIFFIALEKSIFENKDTNIIEIFVNKIHEVIDKVEKQT